MSLINKMLQDLDARGGGRDNAGPSVRSVIMSEQPARTKVVVAVGAAVAVVAAGWFGWKTLHKAPLLKPVTGATVAAGANAAGGGAAPASGSGASAVVGAVAPAGGSGAVVTGGTAGVSAKRAAGAAPGPASAGSAINEPASAMAGSARESMNAGAEASRAGRAARIEAGRQHAAQEAGGADLTAQLQEAKRRAREARAEAAALAASHGSEKKQAMAKPGPQREAVEHTRLAARTAPVREAEVAGASGVTVTSQQQGENAYKRALAALQEGRVQDAMANLEQAVYAYPRHDGARQALVGLLLEARRNDEAMRQLQLGLGLDPKQQQMAMLLARLQIERGGPAVETLMRTLPYAGNNPDYLAFLGGALQKSQRHREAIEQYQAALRLMPQNGVWWMGMGISLQAEKRNAEAVEAYQRAKASGSLSADLASFVERRLAQLGR